MEFITWFKENQEKIILFLVIFLISLFSFALGYIFANQRHKEPIQIQDSLILKKLKPIFANKINLFGDFNCLDRSKL